MSAAAGVLVLVWLVMVIIAVIGLVRGHLSPARIRNRKQAGLLLAASFIVLILIGVLSPADSARETGPRNVVTSTATLPPTTPSTVIVPTSTSSTVAAPAVPSRSTAPVVPDSATQLPPVPTPTTARIPDPMPFAPPPATRQPVPSSSTASAPNVYYADCDAVRAAGAAPLHRGEPGYRKGLDRDNDGIACDK
ncbi:excalibur calcium-binding domain-containing protein [Nocardia sp. NPDC127579]|uniref:excalibur calcium-binding domain-containing protein n=1 Tax=Nocardia sp. NPDC127579 TaxID=3345402 RepID=UPI0036326780